MTRCAILVQKDRPCKAFSGLLQTQQPPKGKKKCEILDLELGKIERNGLKVVRCRKEIHKLRSKTRIVGSFNTERLPLRTENLPIVEQEIRVVVKKKSNENINKSGLDE